MKVSFLANFEQKVRSIDDPNCALLAPPSRTIVEEQARLQRIRFADLERKYADQLVLAKEVAIYRGRWDYCWNLSFSHAAVQTGYATFVSPLTGDRLEARYGSLYHSRTDDFPLVIYHAGSPENAVHLISGGFWNAMIAVYHVAEDALCYLFTEIQAPNVLGGIGLNTVQQIADVLKVHSHDLTLRSLLVQQQEDRPLSLLVGNCYNLGHYVWNEISGIMLLEQAGLLGKLRKVMVGRYDFVEMAGRLKARYGVVVERTLLTDSRYFQSGVNGFRSPNGFPVQTMAGFVSRDTASFLVRTNPPESLSALRHALPQSFAALIFPDPGLTIAPSAGAKQSRPKNSRWRWPPAWLGRRTSTATDTATPGVIPIMRAELIMIVQIRAGTRLWTTQTEGCAKLMRALGRKFPQLRFVIDGMSRYGDFEQAGFDLGLNPYVVSLRQEREIVTDLLTSLDSETRSRTLDIVGWNMTEKLQLYHESSYCFVPAGSSCQLYDWTFNLPGLVYTSPNHYELFGVAEMIVMGEASDFHFLPRGFYINVAADPPWSFDLDIDVLVPFVLSDFNLRARTSIRPPSAGRPISPTSPADDRRNAGPPCLRGACSWTS